MIVEVQTLGRFAVIAGGREVPAITAQPVRAALVVYLALERTVTRDAVLACIWPEADPALARHTLSQTLYQLRQDLGDAWLEVAGSYLRATPRLTLDAVRLAEAVDGGRPAEALALYQGAFLDGCHLVSAATFESWVDRHRGRLARLHHRVRREQIERLVAAGDVAEGLRIARGWVELEPLEDEAQQHLIRLLARTGARGEALRQYADFARLLSLEELEPLPETAALAEDLRGAETREHPPGPGAKGEPFPDASPSRLASARGRRRSLVLAGVTLLAAAAATLVIRERTPGHAIRSVAVLPFENLTGDTAQDYFVEGVHEALIADLSRVSDLRVISRTSVLRYRGGDHSIPEIAGALDVDVVIEGSVLRAGDSVRVQANLIAAATDESLGTVTYDATVRDVLGLLREVARRVADELTAARGRPPDAARGPPPAVDPGAYEAYLRARHLLSSLPGGHWLSVPGLYREALAQDSTLAQAHAGLALAQFAIGFFGLQPRDEVWPLAREAALRALELDDALAEAHAALGYLALYDDWAWDVADRALRHALELNPNDAMARHGYADLLALLGRAEASLEQAEQARAADPLSPLVNGAVIGHLYLARRFDDMLAEARRFQEIFGPADVVGFFEAAALWQLDRYDEALTGFRRRWQGNDALLAAVARGEAAEGARGAMRAAADFLAASAGADPSDVAACYARAGARDAALAWLSRALDARGPTVIHFAIDPVFDSVRGDPRYAGLLRRIGLPPE